jgi:7-cyano-7-deazaguanine synthase
MNLSEALKALPDTKGCVVILSGGMDSTIATRIAVEKYGKENVSALTFFYGQRQASEIGAAQHTCFKLGVKHEVVQADFLQRISRGFSANVDTSLEMPTIQDVLGDPRPPTYVPNRNMILMSIAAAYAETRGVDTIITGLQSTDEYNYHDTTARWIEKVNDLLSENRILKIKLIAPFASLSKVDEIRILKELEGNVELLQSTVTCYNPVGVVACGKCPSCAERLNAFKKAGETDPVQYIYSEEKWG